MSVLKYQLFTLLQDILLKSLGMEGSSRGVDEGGDAKPLLVTGNLALIRTAEATAELHLSVNL